MPREKCCFAGIKYPLNPVPLLSINYTVVRNETEDGVEGGKDEEGRKERGGGKKGRNEACTEREEAIGWKYDSTLSGVPRKFTTEVIDIGAADSLLRGCR